MAMLVTLSAEDLVPADHPIRRIRVVVDDVLASMDARFESLYSTEGRPSVPPEALLIEGVGADGDVLDPFGAGVL